MNAVLGCVLGSGDVTYTLCDHGFGVQLLLAFPDDETCKQWLAQRYDIKWTINGGLEVGTPDGKRWPSQNIIKFHILPNTYYGFADSWLDEMEKL